MFAQSNTIRLNVTVLALIVLAACDRGSPGGGRAPAAPSVPQPADGPGAIAEGLVADRLGADAAEIRIISIEARDFSDSSLDCPEPGMSYLQVITPGHVVIVEANGRRFDVRVSAGYGRICHRRKPGTPPRQEGPGPDNASLINRARTDLAARLGAEPEQIAVLSAAPLSAGQDLPGCVSACEPPSGSCGLLVRLFHAGRHYDYLASDQRTIPCPPIQTS
jgi:hypothetical protein